jgi:DNA primase
MRAVVRALPLLRPAHSLRIVRLPAGMDPDDMLKRDGAGAMEALLGKAQSLLDTLWEHEYAAAPLATPEDKAGLRNRLLDYAAQINDPEVGKLYRKELLDRYYKFIYPDRPFYGSRKSELQKNTEKILYAAYRDALRQFVSGGSRAILEKAVVAGLWKYPELIFDLESELQMFKSDDPDVSYVMDLILDAADGLEREKVSTIWERLGKPPPALISYTNPLHPFLRKGRSDELARQELAHAVRLLTEKPAIEAALADATLRFEREMTNAAFNEQQRLLKRKLELNARLRQMASARAAEPSGEAPKPMAD